MKEPKRQGTQVVFGPCKLSYPHVFEKYQGQDNEEGKYMTNVLIPKDEKKTIEAIEAAIEEAKKAGIVSKWGGKEPKKFTNPLRDGDEKEDEIYEGNMFLNAKSSKRPGVVDKNCSPITDEDEIYGGVWCYVSVTFFPYDFNGNKGVGCALNNLKKFKDDDPIGGGKQTAESDFAEFNDDDEDL